MSCIPLTYSTAPWKMPRRKLELFSITSEMLECDTCWDRHTQAFGFTQLTPPRLIQDHVYFSTALLTWVVPSSIEKSSGRAGLEPITSQLCDFREVTELLWASLMSTYKKQVSQSMQKCAGNHEVLHQCYHDSLPGRDSLKPCWLTDWLINSGQLP